MWVPLGANWHPLGHPGRHHWCWSKSLVDSCTTWHDVIGWADMGGTPGCVCSITVHKLNSFSLADQATGRADTV